MDGTAAGPFNAATASSVAISAAKCAPSVTAGVDKSASYYGDPVTVSGVLNRATGSSVGLSGAPLQVSETVAGRITVLGKATSAADGSYRVVVRPTASGVEGFGVRYFTRSVARSPLSRSTIAPLIPLPPMSTPNAVDAFLLGTWPSPRRLQPTV